MKKKKRKIKGSKIRMLILIPISCLIIGYFLYLIISYPYSIIKLKKEQSVYEKQLLQLEIDEKNLKNEIEKLKDTDYLARYARENYQYSKDGEIILKIDSKSKKETEQETFEINKPILYGGISIFSIILIYILIKSRHWVSFFFIKK